MKIAKAAILIAPALIVISLWQYSTELSADISSDNNTLREWWSPGQGGTLPTLKYYPNDTGMVGTYNKDGEFETKGHPFFEALGENGRACVSCHQPADGMSISLGSIQQRWQETQGKDPIFAAIDGSNCPNLPQGQAASHSLLLERGLFRVFLPWPGKDSEGNKKDVEFDIQVISDPTGCNLDSIYGLKSSEPTISVYRRPRPVANFKYFAFPRGPGLGYNIKDGTPLDRDPETGYPATMNIMADAREQTLQTQARSAARVHLEKKDPLSDQQIEKIFQFERQIFMAQAFDHNAGNLVEKDGPDSLGPIAVAEGIPGLGDDFNNPVFGYFTAWQEPATEAPSAIQQASGNDGGNSLSIADSQKLFRQSVARGSEVFFTRQFWIRDATHINSIGLGNPLKRSCATCHNARMTGMDLAPGWVDLGTTNYPTWNERQVYNEAAALPVFKITCKKDVKPHPYLGREIYTQDPGRALISGRCVDVGSITMQQMRGLSARAPYFANGSAATIAEIVDYYDRRFDISYTEQERQDLINFLSIL